MIESKMTNREVLSTTNDRLLNSLDRQRRFILREYVQPRPCPNCATPLNYFEAKGIDIDDLQFSNPEHDHNHDKGHCPICQRGLIFTLPLMGGWRWRLVPIDIKPSTNGEP
jgi:hypothetical protein